MIFFEPSVRVQAFSILEALFSKPQFFALKFFNEDDVASAVCERTARRIRRVFNDFTMWCPAFLPDLYFKKGAKDLTGV